MAACVLRYPRRPTMDIPTLPAWAWIPITLSAALAQTIRNAAQRSLVSQAGTLAATLARFLYGLPFALVFVAVAQQLSGRPVPAFHAGYFGWVAMGAVAQLLATACLLKAMQQRNFIVGVAFSKTEVLQVALFSTFFLHEVPTWLAALAMLAATLGVVLLSLPARAGAAGGVAAGGASQAVLYGIASGACFALSAVGFRGAALAMPDVAPWLLGGWGVLWAQLLQSLLLGGWLAARDPVALATTARVWRVSILAGAMGALASTGWFTAMAIQPAADVRTLGLVEVFFSLLVSRRIFREKLRAGERWGLALVLLGLVGICLQL
ncbi:DMT transporter permease [Pseudorhodoferax aquiterrae]|uniref:DMT transporter permease n=2 Tax=Pseudorhodoferax aquiterrae TaxID=747304 RepID=A0ABQ3FYA4_9BURK|nr:DMT transporter permease [Pseudorhodoferax aquiterrae]